MDVKRLPKRPAPPRFGRALTEAQKAILLFSCSYCSNIYFDRHRSLRKTMLGRKKKKSFHCLMAGTKLALGLSMLNFLLIL